MGQRLKFVKRQNVRPTLEDVARKAGVSRALVSLVIRGSPHVREARAARVREAIAALGYQPNAHARSLASRRTGIIAVLLNDLHNPFFAEVVDGIEDVVGRVGYRLLLGTGGRRLAREEAALSAFLEHRVDGLILLSPQLRNASIAEAVRTTPVVVVGRIVRVPDVDVVMTDERYGAWLAVSHLVELGHRRIVHIDGGSRAAGPQRRTGYIRAMLKLGLKPAVVAGDFTEVGGVRGAEQLLTAGPLPTAIFAANDLTAVGAIDRLEKEGLHIPADVSVVGYDNISFAALHHVSLTTVNQPREDMGRLAARKLVELLEENEPTAGTHFVRPSLVVRRTTGPPRS